MEAKVNRGYLEYSDERGSYRIPLGRRTRKCLTVLEEREGEFVRSLELDLFTGFVYYCVDNATSGGLSYYYDMSSKKVGHFFIHRYMRTARNHGYTCTPLEEEIFEKLPCENWIEEMEKLPGWKEAIENRVKNLLLPGREVLRIPFSAKTESCRKESCREESGSGEAKAAQSNGGSRQSEIAAVTFLQIPAAYPTLKREYTFLFEETGDRILLRHRNITSGNEFFRENEEYDRILSPEEFSWIRSLLKEAVSREYGPGTGAPAPEADADADADILHDPVTAQLPDLLPHREELIMDAVVLRDRAGNLSGTSTQTQEERTRAEILKAALLGLLRREIELV